MSASDLHGSGLSGMPEPGLSQVPEPPSSGLREPGAGGGPEAGAVSGPHASDTKHDARSASPVTLYDVARMAGVSTATVSRVVHGQDRVADRTRARVREIIDQLGYVPQRETCNTRKCFINII